jgi:PGF-pre-PGF domain-containing protein
MSMMLTKRGFVLLLALLIGLVGVGALMGGGTAVAQTPPTLHQSPTVHILPLGDSITQGENRNSNNYNSYRRPLWSLLQTATASYDVNFVGSWDRAFPDTTSPNPDFDMDHEGHWGWYAEQILNGCVPGCEAGSGTGKLETWLQGYTPDVVLLHIGTNDLKDPGDDQVVVDQTLTEIGQIIDELRADNPQVVVLLAQILPSTRPERALRIPILNAAIPAFAANKTQPNSPVIVVDQNTGFSTSTDLYDGTHPNQTGEQEMADRWFAALENVLTNAWDGPADGDWFVAGNWSKGVGPTAVTQVTIPSGGSPRLTGDAIIGSLHIQSGGRLDLGGYDLTVRGSLSNEGTLIERKTADAPGVKVEFLRLENGAGETIYRGVDLTPTVSLGEVTASLREIDPDAAEACTTDAASAPYTLVCYNISPENAGSATIRLWARADQLGEVPLDELTIYRYRNGVWEPLVTTNSGEVGDFVFAEAETPGFSAFLLGGDMAPTAVTLVNFGINPPAALWLLPGLLVLVMGTAVYWRRTTKNHEPLHTEKTRP